MCVNLRNLRMKRLPSVFHLCFICVHLWLRIMTPDAQILSALRANTDGVSGAGLSQQLGVSRAAIWARIEELRRLGYEIEAGPHFGYRLLNSPDVLHADDLLARLGPTHV